MRRRFWLVMGVEAVGFGHPHGRLDGGRRALLALQLLGTPGAVVGALGSALITPGAHALLYALETVLYVRIRAADGRRPK